MEDYVLTLYSPIITFFGFFPIALIEKNIINIINNKILKTVLLLHMIITLSMILIYFMAILLIKIM